MDVRELKPTTTLRSWLRAAGAGALLLSGMTTLAAPPKAAVPKHAAYLLPPVKLEPGEMAQIARGVDEDLPMGSTPVTRVARKPANEAPAWLSGADPNVIPASGIFSSRSSNDVRTLGSTNLPPVNPMKTGSQPASNMLPKVKPFANPEPQEAGAPVRGMTVNGAPVMAGPPAYRWYGYGSVTPGANAYAPVGQYPKASANWYTVTGATPGAFPVPVVAPYREAPGNEPPNYVVNPPVRTAIPTMPSVRNATSTEIAPPVQKSIPTPTTGVPGMPSISSIGMGSQQLPPLPDPVGVTKPMMPAVPASESISTPAMPMLPEPTGLVPSPASMVLPSKPDTEPTSAVPPPKPPVIEVALPTAPVTPPVEEKKPITGLPVVPTTPALPQASPATLPPAVAEDSRWQPTPETPAPKPPGTWSPAEPTAPTLPPPDLFLQPGAKNTTQPPVARGQMPDTKQDGTIALVQTMCHGKADGIDVRWTGSKKLTVCFEVRSQAEATRLVKGISARPELAPLAIDFCVVVK